MSHLIKHLTKYLMYFHLGQRLVIHSLLEANQTKKCLFGGVSINYKSHHKIFTNCKKMEILKMQMTKDITTQILENEQAGRKLLLERQLQIVVLFAKVLKPKDPLKP